VVCEEPSHCRHVALSESSWQCPFVHHHDVILEVRKAELIFEGPLFHLNRAVLYDAAKFEALACERTMLEEEGRRDALLRLSRFVCLQEGAHRENERAVEHDAEDHDSFQDHSLHSPQERLATEENHLELGSLGRCREAGTLESR